MSARTRDARAPALVLGCFPVQMENPRFFCRKSDDQMRVTVCTACCGVLWCTSLTFVFAHSSSSRKFADTKISLCSAARRIGP